MPLRRLSNKLHLSGPSKILTISSLKQNNKIHVQNVQKEGLIGLLHKASAKFRAHQEMGMNKSKPVRPMLSPIDKSMGNQTLPKPTIDSNVPRSTLHYILNKVVKLHPYKMSWCKK